MDSTSNDKHRQELDRNLYEQLVASVDGVIWEIDAGSCDFTYVSAQAEQLLGFPREEWYKPKFWENQIHPEDRDWVIEYCLKASAEQRNFRFDYRMVASDGQVVWIRDIVSVIAEEGEVTRLRGILLDITAQKQAEDSLKLFRSLLDRSNDTIEIVDAKTGRFLDVNEEACRSHGYTREEFLNLGIPDVDAGDTPAPWKDSTSELWKTGSQVFETKHRRKDGSVFPVEINVTHVRLDRDYILAVVRDITERRRAEHALRESHSLLEAVIEGTSDAVFLKDLDGRYLSVNKAGAAYIGKSVADVIGKTDRDLFKPDSAETILRSDRMVMETGTSQMIEEVLETEGATLTFLATKSVYRDAHGNALGLVGISRDITELKRLEEQYRQAQKMEAVGRLAGGVAHDFNNLLTAINGYSQLIHGNLSPDDPNRELLDEVLKAGDRATDLTGKLLAFSRKQVLQPKVVNLNSLLEELLKMIQRLIGEDIELELRLASDLGLTRVDPSQFDHAILNMVVNSRDAMPGGGRLIFETSNVELDTEYTGFRDEVEPGPYVMVAVSDTGAGIEPSDMERIFEPFFTTKGRGSGTGLGVPMVYGFVKQSGGHIAVYSEVGHGTTFKIYLPRTQDKMSAAAAAAGTSLELPRGSETVLLVEDEATVRSLSKHVLEAGGYRVLEACDGSVALELSRNFTGTIHLMVTDLVMPGMSGRELADLLAPERPEMRVLYMSGYTDEAVIRHGIMAASVAFLQKPFNPAGLARKVREVLDTEAR